MRSATQVDRRQVLQGLAVSAACALMQPAEVTAESTPRELRIYMTSATKKHEEVAKVAWHAAQQGGKLDEVIVDASQSFQPILGFGSAYTDASCFLLNSMKPDARQSFLNDTFSPRGMNLSVGRTSIGASDYSRSLYSYDDTPDDVSMNYFSITHDETYILPMLREMRQINPDLFLLSSPWSPPGWMKTYGSMLGGWMTNKYLGAYANYISRFLDAYRTAGVPIQAITSQNESETDQGGSMPATYWTPEIESDFLLGHLGPILKTKKDPAELWLLDHNYNLWKRVRWQMQNAELRKYVSGVAWHGYVGTPDQMSRLHEAEPQLPFYWTEGGPDVIDPHYADEWTRWGMIFTESITNWCRCIITWNLMLDSKGNPNIGPFQCGGLVTLKDDGTLAYSGQYWALRHFSQHVRRGAVRVASHCDASELNHVAFKNKDGSLALVLTNSGDERDLQLSNGVARATVHLDKQSVSTLTWPSAG